MGTSPTGSAKPGSEPEKTTSNLAGGHSDKPTNHASTVATSIAPLSPEKPSSSVSADVSELWTKSQPLMTDVHPEIWGVTLSNPAEHLPSQIILQKYLNANDQDLAKAFDQLSKTLAWRAKTKPLELVNRKFNPAKFRGLGFVSKYGSDGAEPEKTEVFTWNIYGRVKSVDETFGDLDEFIAWRVALMELALTSQSHGLDLSSATVPCPANRDADPYKITQVHDYKSISFLRQSASVRVASQETIRVFAQNYPELLKEKFFVNVPSVMGFVYEIIKRFVAEQTRKKFHPMSNGMGLSREFRASKVGGLGQMLPPEYGGKGADLEKAALQPLLE